MIGEQEFIKWRCLVALAHADGIVQDEEASFIEKHLANVSLSSEQAAILEQDLASPQKLRLLHEGLVDSAQSRHLIQLAFELFWVDLDFHKAEQKLFMYLRQG